MFDTKSNQTKSKVKVMKKKTATTSTDSGSSVVLEMFKEQNALLKKSVQAAEDRFAKLEAEVAKKASIPTPEKTKEEIEAEKAKNINPNLEVLKAVTALTEKIEKMGSSSVRKGGTTEDGTEEPVTKKALKNLDDEDTVKFVAHVMANQEEYDKLNDGERKKVNSLYLQMTL